MSTKTLFVLGLLFIIVAAYFYAHNDAQLTKVSLKPTDIDYQAEKIKALQTNEQGAVVYQLTANTVTHYQNANTAVLAQPEIVLRPKNQKEIKLVANLAQLDENTQVAKLIGDVLLTSKPVTAANRNSYNTISNNTDLASLPVQMKGKDFIGDLVNNTVTTQQPVIFSQGNNQFEAKNFTGDLNNGNYGFNQVSVTIVPTHMNNP